MQLQYLPRVRRAVLTCRVLIDDHSVFVYAATAPFASQARCAVIHADIDHPMAPHDTQLDNHGLGESAVSVGRYLPPICNSGRWSKSPASPGYLTPADRAPVADLDDLGKVFPRSR